MANIPKHILAVATAPVAKEEFDAWLTLEDVIPFLKEMDKQDEFPVYAGIGQTFLHSFVVPNSLLDPPNMDDLMGWNCSPSSTSWSEWHSYDGRPSVSVAPSPDHTGSETLDHGEQLIFPRFFEGRLGDKNYIEISQKFVHLSGIHFLPERNAYCRLNDHGDIEDVIRIIKASRKTDGVDGTIVLFNRDLLNRYLALTDSSIVQTFDFTRFRSGSFNGWKNRRPTNHFEDSNLFYRSVIEPEHASYMRGCQIVRSGISKDALMTGPGSSDKEKRQYASFIAWDWKNEVLCEISCGPDATANYFTESNLPFETTPAFFRPEVLAKYKSDFDKYQLTDRTISCRGTWYLQTYDINDAGQVHTYLVYLRSLPYEEQVHWKAYNEKPKGSISKRAFTTDFEGKWDLEYDPLHSLKDQLRKLNEKHVPWWTMRSDKLLDQVHYPVTASADEWANELLQLDKLLVEGFEEKWLREKAQSLGRTLEPQFRSLKLVEECLIGLGFEDDHARKITGPLHEVHSLRSKLKGHASGEGATEIKARVIAEHGGYKEQFRALAGKCDESMQTITEALKKLF